MDINYELYKVFYCVGKTLSFSEASKMLFISQSAVSQSIKTLEKKLNQTLFVRSTKKVVMTKEGELLFKHVESAVNLLKRGEMQLSEAGALGGGQLRIAANDTICRYFLVPYLNEFHKAFPNVQITVKNGTSSRCVEYLQSNEVDFIITNYPNSKLSGIATIVDIKEFRDVFIVNSEAFGYHNEIVSYEKLSKMPIMMLERNTATSTFLHDIFLKKGIDLVPDVEISSNDLLMDLAKIGLGVAFIPDYCVKDLQAGMSLIKLEEKITPRKLVAAYDEAAPLSEVVKYFLNLLKENKTV